MLIVHLFGENLVMVKKHVFLQSGDLQKSYQITKSANLSP